MLRSNLVGVLLLLAAVPAYAAEPKLPAQGTPEIGLGLIDAHGNLDISTVVTKPIWETQTRQEVYTVTRDVDGHQVPETRVRTLTFQVCHCYVNETRVTRFNAGDFCVRRDGALLDARAAAELLSHSTPIVFAYGPALAQLDPFYLQFFQPGTVMVGVKSEPLPVAAPLPPVESPPRPGVAPAPPPPRPRPYAPAAPAPAPAPYAPASPAPPPPGPPPSYAPPAPAPVPPATPAPYSPAPPRAPVSDR